MINISVQSITQKRMMKKRTEIQQDLKRGFGSIPIGIKILVKWLLVGFVAYVAVRFVCAFVGGMVTDYTGRRRKHNT